MEKALELLEKHCQWLAVGLGGLFLAWMLWAYVLMTPTEVPKGSVTYTPGTVDDIVSKNYAEPLDAEINRQDAEKPPVITAANPLDHWMPLMKDGSDKPLLATLPPYTPSLTDDFKIGPRGPEDDLKADPVTALPVPPPTYVTELVSRRVYHGDPPPPAAAPGQPQPPAPPVAPLVAGQTPPGKDLSYVRLSYRIPAAEISKVFQAANVPAAGAQTAVIAIKVMRQELQPDGTWGKETEVPYLKNNVWPYPLPQNPGQVNWFRGWSDSPQGQLELLRPLFYPVVFGEGPWDQSMDDLMPKYDAKAIAAQRAKEAKEREAARKAATPTAPPRSGGGRMPRRGRGDEGGEPVVPDAQRPSDLGGVVSEPFYQVPGRTPRMPVMPPGMNGEQPNPDESGDMGGMQPGMPQLAPGQTPPPAEMLPTPNFTPSATTDFLCWAYDETVQEGHTYRYQVLYALRSPVYESNVTKPPELAQVFAIWSTPDPKAWSWPVEVKPTAEFYLATNNWPEGRTPPNIKFEVFKWAQGKWQSSTFTVSPGDKVGDKVSDKAGDAQAAIDYSTNVTVVDLKYDPRGNNGQGRPYVLLLTDDGRLIERDPSLDRANERMLQLKQFIQVNNPPAPPGAPVPGAVGAAGGLPPVAGGRTSLPYELPAAK